MKRIYQLNIARLAHSLIVVALLVYFLIVLQDILMPLAFAAILAFLLRPLSGFFDGFIKNQILSALCTIITAITPIFLLLIFFFWQFVGVFENLPAVSEKLKSGILTFIQSVGHRLDIPSFSLESWLGDNLSTFLEAPIALLGSSISSSTLVIGNFFLVFLFTLFFLLYRKAFKQFFLLQFEPKMRSDAKDTLMEVQQVVQNYLLGVLTVIIILSVLNSLALYLIGIKYAWFWGLLAAFLAIIPYVGTFIGGLLPFVYAIASTGTWWQPAAVAALFLVIQFVEGNFITPKVVGESVKINPFFAIISLIVGGMLWGIAGIVLALPGLAILRIILKQIPIFMPISALLSSELYKDADLFEEKFDSEKYRIASFFKFRN